MFRPRRLIPVAAAAALLLLAAAASAGAHYSNPGAKDCGFIVFTPQTDDGASAIRARNLSCRKARRLVKAFKRGDSTPLGFRCRSRAHDEGLAHADVRCRRGRRVVTFART